MVVDDQPILRLGLILFNIRAAVVATANTATTAGAPAATVTMVIVAVVALVNKVILSMGSASALPRDRLPSRVALLLGAAHYYSPYPSSARLEETIEVNTV